MKRCSAEIGVDTPYRRRPVRRIDGPARAVSVQGMIPNAITALALCVGPDRVRFAIGGEWDEALGAIVAAGVLDGMDGRIARCCAPRANSAPNWIR